MAMAMKVPTVSVLMLTTTGGRMASTMPKYGNRLTTPLIIPIT